MDQQAPSQTPPPIPVTLYYKQIDGQNLYSRPNHLRHFNSRAKTPKTAPITIDRLTERDLQTSPFPLYFPRIYLLIIVIFKTWHSSIGGTLFQVVQILLMQDKPANVLAALTST